MSNELVSVPFLPVEYDRPSQRGAQAMSTEEPMLQRILFMKDEKEIGAVFDNGYRCRVRVSPPCGPQDVATALHDMADGLLKHPS